MKNKFALWMAVKLIWGNRGKAAIPIFGIATGISLVFVILAMGEGGRRTVRNDLSLLGENRIMVGPGGSRRAKAFDMKDMKRIEGIPGVEYVHLMDNRMGATTERGGRIEVTGYSPRAMESMEMEMVSGRGFPIESGKIIIDERTAREEYGTTDVTGQTLAIQMGNRKREYVIQGVYRDGMDSVRNGGQAMAAASEIEEITGRVRSREMIVAFYEGERGETLYSLILATLDRSHGGRDLYRISETNSRYQRIKKIMSIINISLGSMGGAALLLGGALAANMMLMSIKEREPHIGILRAVGTSGRGVGRIFLFETLMVTCTGGVLGIPLGIAAAHIIGKVTGVTPIYGAGQVVVTGSIAVIMGAVAGYYPAMKAARMEPMDAIRG